MTHYKMLIGGQWVDSVTGKTFEKRNPATGELNGIVAEAQPEDVDLAVKAARKAFESGPWPEMSPTERGRLLYKALQKIIENKERLAEIESRDNGQPINETTMISLNSCINVLEFYAGITNKLQGDTLSSPRDRLNFTLKEPIGVCAGIVPWNFPLIMAIWKIAPALAAGNTVVLKPAEDTPISALELAKLFQEAGFPDGVINVVPGMGEIAGQALASHPGIDKIAFTGSTEVGRLIMQAASKHIKPVSLELGGKSPNIIFDDANLEDAVNVSLFGIYFNQGQVCQAGSRLFVHEKIYDQFMDLFVSKANKIKVGNPLDRETQMGPLISEKQLKRVQYYVQKGIEEGAKLVIGGERDTNLPHGYFFRPTIFENVENKMTIAQEEIFGPVLSVIRFKDEEDVLQKANDTIYGLTAGVWTNDLKRALRMARGLKAGTVYVNSYGRLDPNGPFGGYKQSGFGRELGIQAMDMYLNTKHVWIDLSENGANWYGY